MYSKKTIFKIITRGPIGVTLLFVAFAAISNNDVQAKKLSATHRTRAHAEPMSPREHAFRSAPMRDIIPQLVTYLSMTDSAHLATAFGKERTGFLQWGFGGAVDFMNTARDRKQARLVSEAVQQAILEKDKIDDPESTLR